MSKQSKNSAIDVIASECLAVRLRQVNRAVTNLYDDALRPLGLKVSQLNILVCAAKFGLAQRDQVSRYLLLESSTLSRNIEPMRRKGWIEIMPGKDARTAPFRLTAAGRRLLEKVVPAWEKAQRQTLEVLGEDAMEFLSAAVRRIRSPKGGQ